MPQRRIVGLRFERVGRVFYFDPGDLELQLNDRVAVMDDGAQVGRVVIAPDQVLETGFREPLKLILGKAAAEDLREPGKV